MPDNKAPPESNKNSNVRLTAGATPTMDSPATYRICVEGTLNAEWADRLAGLSITSPDAGKTILVGRLKDQAALSGVLATLYELHLPVSSVECLESG